MVWKIKNLKSPLGNWVHPFFDNKPKQILSVITALSPKKKQTKATIGIYEFQIKNRHLWISVYITLFQEMEAFELTIRDCRKIGFNAKVISFFDNEPKQILSAITVLSPRRN